MQPPQTNHNATLKLIVKHLALTLLTSLFPNLRPHHQPTFQLLYSFLPRYTPPDLLTQDQPLQYSIRLLPVLATASHSLLVTRPRASQIYRVSRASLRSSYSTTELLMTATDVGLSLYGLLSVPQRTDFGSQGQIHRQLVSDRQWVRA